MTSPARLLRVAASVGLCISAFPGSADATEPTDFPWVLVDSSRDPGPPTLADPAIASQLDACARGHAYPGRAADCVRVMTIVAHAKAPFHAALRRIIRDGRDGRAIAEAAAALAITPERDNCDLFLWALLEGRGGDVAAPHLIDAYLNGQPPWPGHYLRFVSMHGPTPFVRALAADRVIARGLTKVRDLPSLVAALAASPPEAPETQAFLARADQLRSVCDLDAIAAARTNGRLNSLVIGPRCRSGASSNPPPTAQLRETCHGGRTIGALDRTEVRAAARACAEITDPAMFHRQTALARRFPKMRIAATYASAQPGDDLGRPWLRRPPRPPGDTPPLAAASYDPTRFPPDFWGFDPLLKQPSWYPAHVHLTIDDGPRPDYLSPTLDVLEKYEVKVTLFFVGAALVRRYLDDPAGIQAILARVIASGHGVGYHSMNHDTLPEIHESEREPDQFADSVTLYRWLLKRLTGESVPVVHGRFPGGRGAFLEAMPRLYAEAGLMQHVFWTFGPGYWVQNTPAWVVAGMACELARAPEPVTILLHEFPMMPIHFEAFLRTIRNQCPADALPAPPDTRTVWRKDDVFAPTLCNSDHPDLRRLCERPPAHERAARKRSDRARKPPRIVRSDGRSGAGGAGRGTPLHREP